MVETLEKLCNTVWVHEEIPDEWKTGIIIPLPKKGDLSDCSNWRGITLLSLPSKVLCHVILKRIKSAVETTLREEQNGFRPARSCTDAIFSLRSIINKTVAAETPVFIHFVDFQKAFDSIHRETLWEIVKYYGIPQKCINVMMAIYDNSKCCVRLGGEKTKTFDIKTGVRQGCVLSPFLFCLVIDFILRKLDRNEFGIPIEGQRIFDLDFADDIALMDVSNEKLQSSTNELKDMAEKIGLRFNVKKCEAMSTVGTEPHIKIDTQPVKAITSFTYLGSKINNTGNAQDEIRVRIGKAGAAFGKIEHILKSKNMSLKTKLNLYSATVLSVLLYGSETWHLYAADGKRLNAFHQRCLRRMLKVSYMEHVTNIEILKRTGQRELTEILRERRLRWFGHVVRMGEERIPKRVLNWIPPGRRKRGRPRLSWRGTLEGDLKKLDITWKEAEDLALQRDQWRRVAALCASMHGKD